MMPSPRQSRRKLVGKPLEGSTITRITVSECVYIWKLDESDKGDWYPMGPRIVYEHPKWKDIPGNA